MKGTTKKQNRVLTIDACGQALNARGRGGSGGQLEGWMCGVSKLCVE